MSNLFPGKRKNYMEPGEIFFWTATINNWQPLLADERFIKIILNALEYLTNAEKVDLFAFVIMPTHLHFIWRVNGMNGKETVQGSFLKYTAHEFKKLLREDAPETLKKYTVDASNKNFEFWKRDSLAIHLFSKKIAYQKLDYTHYNPCAGKWNLADDPINYFYSSAKFYETGEKNFFFLKDLREEF